MGCVGAGSPYPLGTEYTGLGNLVVRASDLRLNGREFDPSTATAVVWYWDG